MTFRHASWVALCVIGALWGCTPESGNLPPISRAGTDAVAFIGDAVSLDGSASFDPDQDPLTYEWQLLSAPASSALIPSDASVDANETYVFTADAVGSYVFALVVSDGTDSSRDIVAVDIRNVLNVVQTVPVDLATGIAGRAPAVVFFSEPIRSWTAEAAVVLEDVTDLASPIPVLGTYSVDDGNTAVVFTPAADWGDLVPYRITATTQARGLDGAPLRVPVEVTFTGSIVEAVGRCSNGRDTDNDINDFFQNELGGFEMARTPFSSNNAECPTCADGVDNDGDGWFDLDDPDCANNPLGTEPSVLSLSGSDCNDGVDSGADADTDIDAADSDCFDGFDNDEGI